MPIRELFRSNFISLGLGLRLQIVVVNITVSRYLLSRNNRTSLLIIGLSIYLLLASIIRIRITDSQTHSIITWQSCIRAQMISTDKALINSNNPNILIQLYKSENYLTTNGQVRCYAINSKFTDRFGFKNRPVSILYQFTDHFRKKCVGIAPHTPTPPPLGRPCFYLPRTISLSMNMNIALDVDSFL